MEQPSAEDKVSSERERSRRTEKDTFRCATCRIELRDRTEMIEHMRTHAPTSTSKTQNEENTSPQSAQLRPVPTPQDSDARTATPATPPTTPEPPAERIQCFRCLVCLAEHETKEAAMAHAQEHQIPEDDAAEPKKHVVRRMAFKCQKCGEEMKSSEEFLDHMVVNHNAHPHMYGSRKVYCPEVKSVPQETTVVTFGCPKCSEVFTLKDDMLAHVEKEHGSNSILTFRCAECQAPFSSRVDVLQHVEQEHPRAATRLETMSGALMSCPICKHPVNSRDEMSAHLRTHDSVTETLADTIEEEIFERVKEEENVVFRCSVCGVHMASKLEVVRHMSEVHGSNGTDAQESTDEIKGKIVRQMDPVSGEARTIVERACGKTYTFDDAETIKYIKMDDDSKVDYMTGLCLLGMRGLVTELGQRLVDESKLFKQRKQERELLVQNTAYIFFGLTDGATAKDLQDAYKIKARLLHPDKNGGTEEAKAKFQRMKQLHEILKTHFAVAEEAPAESLSPETAPTTECQPDSPQAAPKEAYDEEEPIKRDDQKKSLSYDPRNRASMEKALGVMCSEISQAWKNIVLMTQEIQTLEKELIISA
eukprot:GEMP01005068.1.p1 GENE.GEMP01005068.1~~GEMP01005068.1.p1  ORF type:complete len:591 (+),score=156.68 GEMP01005068.1:143-1915(+)